MSLSKTTLRVKGLFGLFVYTAVNNQVKIRQKFKQDWNLEAEIEAETTEVHRLLTDYGGKLLTVETLQEHSLQRPWRDTTFSNTMKKHGLML